MSCMAVSIQVISRRVLLLLFADCVELVPVCLCLLAPANLCPCEIWFLCVFGVRCHLVHRAMVLRRVSTMVALCAALIGGGAVGAESEIAASVPALASLPRSYAHVGT